MTSARRKRAITVLSGLGLLLLPVLFAVFPLLSLFQQNQSEIELDVLRWPLGLCVAAAAVVYGLFLLARQEKTTNVIWTMDGRSPYIAKLMGVFVNMDTMIGKDFETGLANLKAIAEKP